MPIKNTSVKVPVVAWDTTNQCGKTGEAAKIILKGIADGVEYTPSTADFVEVDATNLKGVYCATVATSDNNCYFNTIGGSTPTTGIAIIPITWSNVDLAASVASVAAIKTVVDNCSTKASVAAIKTVVDGVDSSLSASLASLTLTKIADAVLDEVAEDAYGLRHALRLLFGVLGGISTGGGTTEIKFKSLDGNKTRVTATVDVGGNRSSITLDLT